MDTKAFNLLILRPAATALAYMSEVRFHFVHHDPDDESVIKYADDMSEEIATEILQRPGGGTL